MTDIFNAHYKLIQSDPQARQRLIDNPKEELARFFGAPLPDGPYKLEIIGQRPDTITVVIPAPPAGIGDTSTRLSAVSGRILDLLFTSGIGGYLIPTDELTWTLRDIRSTWTNNRGPDERHNPPPADDEPPT